MPEEKDGLLVLPPPDQLLSDGKRFARIYGKGAPLLLIHGNWGCGKAFARILDALAAEYTVILPDLPGHGCGPVMTDADLNDKRAAVNYCDGIMRDLGYSSYIAAGHSLGGIIALELAIELPEKITHVISLDGFVRLAERSVFPYTDTRSCYPGNPPEYQKMIDEACSCGPGVKWHIAYDAGMQARHIVCPVLEMIPLRSPGFEKYYDQFLREERRDYPKTWKDLCVPCSRHFVMIEQPGFVSREMLKFLRKEDYGINTQEQ